jgi:hypothetical protein
LALFCGGLFGIFRRFRALLVNFGSFLGLIFPFGAHFWSRHTVYSQTNVDPVLQPIAGQSHWFDAFRNSPPHQTVILGAFLRAWNPTGTLRALISWSLDAVMPAVNPISNTASLPAATLIFAYDTHLQHPTPHPYQPLP